MTDRDPAPPSRRRPALTRDAVLREAVALADEVGTDALSMRKLAERLGVEAMSLYHHVRNKDAILDGMVDIVFGEIELPSGEWRAAIRRRSESMREVLTRHGWAVGLLNARTNPGWATLRHHDEVLGCLREGGFGVAGAAHAISLLDSYVYGFVVQELSLPFDVSGADSGELDEVAAVIMTRMSEGELPHLAEMITEHALQPGYAYAEEFGVGLDLVLDGLEQRRDQWLT